MERSPVWATMVGDHRFDDRLPVVTPESEAADADARRDFLDRARALDPDALAPSDRLTLGLFIHRLTAEVEREVCAEWQWNVSPRGNPLVRAGYLPELHPLESEADGERFLARLGALPRALDEQAANLRTGLEAGRVANRTSAILTVEMVRAQLERPDEEWPLLELTGEAEWIEALRPEVKTLLAEEIRPAFERWVDVLEEDVVPAGREGAAVGLGGLPEGAACYEALVGHYTTLDVTAQELHDTGLTDLERIHAEMQDLGEALFDTRDLGEIFDRLRHSDDLYFETEAEVEQKAVEAVDAAREAMGAAFGRLPRAEVIVRPVPAHEAPYTTIAYYRRPAPDGARPGEYYVNTYAPETRPRYEAEVLAFHEAIPGHHLQIAIAQELPDNPGFRRHGGVTAFVEGWALYTERLSDELGLYSGDLDRMGMLSFDTWRAARLVVDTGIHSLGWTRAEAEDFLRENTPLADNNIVNEVDRYITMPGQALAYKAGQLEILALRAEAEEALGDAFELSAFHDVVLGAGALPLPVLRERVEIWVEAVASGAPGAG